MRSTQETYRDELLVALRLRGVPAARIGEVLAEVDSHVADTREDPREAFGEPRAYAEQVAEALGTPRRSIWLPDSLGDAVSTVATALCSFVGAVLLAHGVFTLLSGGRAVAGGRPVAVVLLGLALLGSVVVHLLTVVRRRSDAVVDPRTGAPVQLARGWVGPVLLAAVPVGIVVLGAAAALAQRT